MLLTPRRPRQRAAFLAAMGFIAGGLVTSVVAPPSRVAAAVPPAHVAGYGDTLTIRGRGFGHGYGMGQFGAYGYAVDKKWDWHQILAHYYGGTAEAAMPAGTTVSVRLTGLDDLGVTVLAGTGDANKVVTSAVAGSYAALYVVRVATDTFAVYSGSGCPASDPAAADSGWTKVAQVHAAPGVDGVRRVSFDRAGALGRADADSDPVPSLLRVCQPDRTAIAYRGSVFTVDSGGSQRFVNVLGIDAYVRGVVPRESPASWGSAGGGAGMNALRAQAVAARTYALAEHRYRINGDPNQPIYAMTCETQSCQVYGGAGLFTIASQRVLEDSRSDQAVVDTAGVVLTMPGAAPVLQRLAYTEFSSSTGGYTAGGQFPAVPDDGDATAINPYDQWTTTVPVATVTAAWPAIGALVYVDVTARNGLGEFGGRVKTLTLHGTTGSVNITGDQFRRALGLRSTWFNVDPPCDGRTAGNATPPVLQGQGRFTAVTPDRIIDTRDGTGSAALPLAAGCVMPVTVAGVSGVPIDATAVALDIVAVNAATAGYVTAFPCGGTVPNSSTVNYVDGRAVANLAIVGVGANHQVCLFSYASVDLVVDVLGFFSTSTGDGFARSAPTRLLDTRDGTGGVPKGVRVVHDQVTTLPVPAGDATAVIVNLTTTGAVKDGFVTAYPCDGPMPPTSNVNPRAGADLAVANLAIVGVTATGPAAGSICLFSSVDTHLVVDLFGSFGPSGSAVFTPVAPGRVLDTRLVPPKVAASDRAVTLAGQRGLPAAAAVTAALVNLTVTSTKAPGYVAMRACDRPLPNVSNVNFVKGLTVANLGLTELDATGAACAQGSQAVDLIVDVEGWFGPASPG